MERLNLYNQKERYMSLKRFLFYIFIILVPFFSTFFLAQFWLYLSISNTIEKYPLVFNNITFLDPLEIPNIIENKINEYDSKLNIIVNKITYYKNYLNNVFYSKYFLQMLFDFFNTKKEDFFIKSIKFDGKKFSILFYEYSNVPEDFESVIKNLSKFYKNISIKLNDTKVLYSDFKMFEFIMEGEL
ncbi:hypothetical protein SU69_08825 [Thermosipho melanesiensis]|uniref:Uncharacterized protein n=2 Tax=Thermosipho melanesiensis TaxID=46541 RepID=A6LNT4_THEM4|nr:hypothetical protein [Thermosipho melanesiensis]ABR31585.1 hypothetical protein Tmel_1746 [Thermosipho melanesiensis BI429]APT74617.1 hypothetical protein BW47_09200 [Thermosipho melanesiensis]OOC35321.1 hypothetical protein SU69_08825 [Thermosipho melanesiensis]OOC35539.1 hypothetical protein SU70_08835 [Thermosipho melanesiensis]OOC36576.1 hypothetical protein SU68_08890 [Thermosipho melanesiensis]